MVTSLVTVHKVDPLNWPGSSSLNHCPHVSFVRNSNRSGVVLIDGCFCSWKNNQAKPVLRAELMGNASNFTHQSLSKDFFWLCEKSCMTLLCFQSKLHKNMSSSDVTGVSVWGLHVWRAKATFTTTSIIHPTLELVEYLKNWDIVFLH